jgi:hypothetical protein
MKRKTISALRVSLAALLTSGTMAYAGNDPACLGKDQTVCDTLGAMINARGKGCYRMMSVSQVGSNGYRINCVVSSASEARITYTLQFSNDQSSYTLN